MSAKIEEIRDLYQQVFKGTSSLSQADGTWNRTMIRRKLEAFELYKEYLQENSRVLDWGCKAALDSYLIKDFFSGQVELHGCDVFEERKYSVFYDEINLIFKQLLHTYHMPYEDRYFDFVVASGVLEHVANDYESLKELHRIIRSEGYLVITFLPNELSYTEVIWGDVLKRGGHIRRYSLKEIQKMLLHTGFQPISYGYHQLIPTFSGLRQVIGKSQSLMNISTAIDALYRVTNGTLERTWPINKLSANLFVVAKRRSYFGQAHTFNA